VVIELKISRIYHEKQVIDHWCSSHIYYEESRMIVQNNSTPWIFLGLLVMIGCVLAGMLLSQAGPFSTEIAVAKMQITQTQASIKANATNSALQSIQTEQAPAAQQTVVAANFTSMPLQQTATHMAEVGQVLAAEVRITQTALAYSAQNGQIIAQATQTAIADEIYYQQLINNATATALAHHQLREKNSSFATSIVIVFAIFALSAGFIAWNSMRVMKVRAALLTSQARVLTEQRRLFILRNSDMAHKRPQRDHMSLSSSLMRSPGDIDSLPKAE
jgi:DMSO reductase anchor subunit